MSEDRPGDERYVDGGVRVVEASDKAMGRWGYSSGLNTGRMWSFGWVADG